MALVTKKLSFFRQKIISYYEELINVIDVKTEEFLSHKNFESGDIDVINARRNEWINKIELVRKQNIFELDKTTNLATLNLLINDEEQLNYVLFKNGYLIFTQNKPFYDDDSLFIGKLIFKNGYLNRNVIKIYELVYFLFYLKYGLKF